MSAKVMGQVYDYKLPHGEQTVLLAVADHADHDGEHAFPSVPLIAWKINYTERQVRRLMKQLRDRGVLVVTAKSKRHKPTEYRIVLNSLTRKAPRVRPDVATGLEVAVGLTSSAVDLTSATFRPDAQTPLTVLRNRPNEPRDFSVKTTGEDCVWVPDYSPSGGLRCATCKLPARKHA